MSGTNGNDDIRVARWVVTAGIVAALFSALMLIVVAGISFQGMRASMRAVDELSTMNAFWTRLEREQRARNQARADSIKARLDSIERGRQ